jgi:hypothetical protein
MVSSKEMFLAMQTMENLNIEEMDFCVEPTMKSESVDFNVEKSVLCIRGSMSLVNQKTLSFNVSYQFNHIDIGFKIELDNGLASCTLLACNSHKISVVCRNDLIEQIEVVALNPTLPSYLIQRESHLAIPTQLSRSN